MKRISIGILALVFMMTMVLSACGSTATKPAAEATKATEAAEVPKAAEAAKPTNISFWTFVELHKQFHDDAVVTWNKANPDKQIVMKTEVYPYDDMHNKLLIALQSGSGAPDVVDIEISKYANFLKGNIGLEPLNSVIDPIKDNLIMARMDNYAKDGKYYGIDYHVGAEVMYYNKELMDKAGVNPDDIKLMSDFKEAAKKVTAATGKPMITFELSDQWSFYPFLSQQGGDYFDKSGKVSLNSDISKNILQFTLDMIYKDKTAILAPGGGHHTEEYYAFMNKGGAASITMPLWYMGRFTQYMPDLKGKIVIKPVPAWTEGGNRSAGMGGTGTSVVAASKVKDLAIQYLAAAKLSKEGSIKTWSILGFDPIRKDVYDDPAMSATNQYTDYFGTDIFSVVKGVQNQINSINMTDKYPAAVDLLRKNVLFKVLKEQSQTPEQALKAAEDELNKN